MLIGLLFRPVRGICFAVCPSIVQLSINLLFCLEFRVLSCTMKLAQKHLLLVLLQYLPLSLAQTDCTQSTALKYTTADDPCSAAATARDDTGCVAKYCENGGTSKSLNACFCLAGIGENCGSIGSRDLVVESLERRAGFTCSSSEACYINPADGGLFCLDVSTGEHFLVLK